MTGTSDNEPEGQNPSQGGAGDPAQPPPYGQPVYPPAPPPAQPQYPQQPPVQTPYPQPQYGQQPPGQQGTPTGPPTYPGAPPAYPGAPQQPYGTYPQQGGAPVYPGGVYQGPPPKGSGGWSGFAITAFILSIVLPIIGIFVAVPLAIVALVKMGARGQKGKVLAILAIVISVLWWAGAIGIGVFFATHHVERDSSGAITKSGLIDFDEIRADDCVKIDNPSDNKTVSPLDVKGVPCSETHNAQAAGVIKQTGDVYPGFDALISQSQGPCRAQARAWGDPGKVTGLNLYLLAPTEDMWDNSDSNHQVICFVVADGYANIDGSVAR